MKLRIATRKSPLALWQADFVQQALERQHPDCDIEQLHCVTQGDKTLDTPLAKVGGKGLFIKELEQALLDGQADIAVHSMKDVPMALPDGFALAAICQREDPSDAFVANHYSHFNELPAGSVIGTSSLRRQSQLLAARPDLSVRFLRGNVGTRLAKLDAGEYDAIILASAGLRRLGLAERIAHNLDWQLCLPAVGQGAVGIEIRAQDDRIAQLIKPLTDPDTWLRVSAERAMNRRLAGSCQVPIAGFAEILDGCLVLEGRVAKPDGSLLLKSRHTLRLNDSTNQPAETLGAQVADELLQQGAGEILAAFSD